MVGFAACAEGGIAKSRRYCKFNSSSCLQDTEDAVDSLKLFWESPPHIVKPPLSQGRHCQAGLEQPPAGKE